MINMIHDILGFLSSKGYDRKVQKLRPAFLAEVHHRNLWSRSGRRKAGGGGYQDPVPSLSWKQVTMELDAKLMLRHFWVKMKQSEGVIGCPSLVEWERLPGSGVQFQALRVHARIWLCWWRGRGMHTGFLEKFKCKSTVQAVPREHHHIFFKSVFQQFKRCRREVGLCPVQHIWGAISIVANGASETLSGRWHQLTCYVGHECHTKGRAFGQRQAIDQMLVNWTDIDCHTHMTVQEADASSRELKTSHQMPFWKSSGLIKNLTWLWGHPTLQCPENALVPPGVFEMSRIVCAKVATKTAAVHSRLDRWRIWCGGNLYGWVLKLKSPNRSSRHGA